MMQQRASYLRSWWRCGSASFCSANPLRIPRPKIDKLACQARARVFSPYGEITFRDAYCNIFDFSVFFLGSATLCPVAVPEIFCSLSLTKFRPLPLLMPRFFCHWQRSATSPLRYPSVRGDLIILPQFGQVNFLVFGVWFAQNALQNLGLNTSPHSGHLYFIFQNKTLPDSYFSQDCCCFRLYK